MERPIDLPCVRVAGPAEPHSGPSVSTLPVPEAKHFDIIQKKDFSSMSTSDPIANPVASVLIIYPESDHLALTLLQFWSQHYSSLDY